MRDPCPLKYVGHTECSSHGAAENPRNRGNPPKKCELQGFLRGILGVQTIAHTGGRRVKSSL